MRAWLSQEDVDLQVRDFFGDRFSETELRGLLGDRPVGDYFSWVSPSFRKLDVDRHTLSDDQLIAMMLEEPRLIRRPLIVVNGELLDPKSGVNRIVPAVEARIQSQ